MLINGEWSQDYHPVQKSDSQGRFVRQTSSFRNWITPDGSAGPTGSHGFKAEPNRYRLYVAFVCPWASRTLIARKLKNIEDLVSVTVVSPVLTLQGWEFGNFQGAEDDPIFGAKYLHEIYSRADNNYTGRATVPVLWDEKQQCIVNNESSDILRMFDSAFEDHIESDFCLYPKDLSNEIDSWNNRLNVLLNDGVYKSGFASSQQAYDEAVTGVFLALEELENQLTGDYIFGDRLTDTDIRVFVTLIRFDAAYYSLFKTNQKQLRDYPRLSAYVRRIINIPGVRETVNMEHIIAGYYSIKACNPTGIVPTTPAHVNKLITE